ncbi:cation:proton antiporter [Streptomyces sp. TLI_146]|uniref:cation:proton antiporter n=1 Tax=Streptomyces sp. TLI_146 TaxID=1938858 RepID=UPI000C7097A7|nr:cation:proton antiporter [Streptomyces sp. TLI_146]PKV84108.1 Kef-type K+ transport system membrane component KefB [Streptomyces sp. TLI_146]
MSTDLAITHLIGATAVILLIANGAGVLARKLGQPSIVGQLIAGIALGPSLLGQLPSSVGKTLFPAEITPMMTGLSQVSLVLFLYFIGYELDLKVLRGRSRVTLSVAVAALVVPMMVGAGAAVLFHGTLEKLGLPHEMSFRSVLFLAVALSITAVPVLIVVVRESGLAGTVPGVVAVSAAGLIDVAGWMVLVATLMGSGGASGLSVPVRIVLLLLAVAVMAWPVRLLLRRVMRRPAVSTQARLAVLIGFAFAAAWVTSALGLHVIFGALLAGVVTPREPDGTLDPDLVRSLDAIGSLFLPFFFVVSGRSVSISSMGGTAIAVLIGVTVLAVVVKVGSGALAARVSGLDGRTSVTIGVLLSTRGLTELIALNAGYQAGLLSESLYTVLVLMAIITTLLTQPLLVLTRRYKAQGAGGTDSAGLRETADAR